MLRGRRSLTAMSRWRELFKQGLAADKNVVAHRMCCRASSRIAFGKRVSEQTVTQERIAEARIMIEQARLLTLNAAHAMDTVGNKVARAEIAMIKVAVPNMACQVIDRAIQAHGGGGTSNDFGLAAAYATAAPAAPC